MHCVSLIKCTKQFEWFQAASGIVSQVMDRAECVLCEDLPP